MNRPLVLSGAGLVAVGAVLLILMFAGGDAPAVAGGVPPTDSSFFASDPPSRLWAIVIGLVIAVGAGMIGIGMNRWKSQGD